MFQTREILGACVAAGLALAAPPATAGAGLPVAVPAQHRVEVVIATEGERVAMTRATDRGAVRTDLHNEAGRFATVIEPPDKETVFVLVPEREIYLEGPIARRSATHQPERGLRSERLGRVTLDGRPADKFRLSNARGTAHLWIEPRTRYPIRVEDRSTRVSWSPFDVGAQPAALFEPPSRRTRLGVPDFLGGPNGALGQMMSDQIPFILEQQLGEDLVAKIRRSARTPLGIILSRLFGPTWEKMLLNAR